MEEAIKMNHIIFHDDFEIRKRAKHLGYIINTWNLPDDGEVNKTIAILEAGRAYVHYLEDQHNNPTYNNPGSFWLIFVILQKRWNRVINLSFRNALRVCQNWKITTYVGTHPLNFYIAVR